LVMLASERALTLRVLLQPDLHPAVKVIFAALAVMRGDGRPMATKRELAAATAQPEPQAKATYCWGCGNKPWKDGTLCGCKGGPRCGFCATGQPELCEGGICRNPAAAVIALQDPRSCKEAL
jgi:hypothetical protein